MRAIVGRIGKAFSDPGSVVSVIADLLVGALLGGHYEPRTPAHEAQARRTHPGDEVDDQLPSGTRQRTSRPSPPGPAAYRIPRRPAGRNVRYGA